jgi:hypothetical protein
MLAACIPIPTFGDRAHAVTFVNTLPTPVRVYEQGRDVPRFFRDVPVGGSAESAWLWPLDASDRRSRRVEATDESGRLVFCMDFTYEKLEAVKWRILIVQAGCSEP